MWGSLAPLPPKGLWLAPSDCTDLSLHQACTGRGAELRSKLSGSENSGFFEAARLRWVLPERLASRGLFWALGASPRLWELLVRGEGWGGRVVLCGPAGSRCCLPCGQRACSGAEAAPWDPSACRLGGGPGETGEG